jgi:hypothetical protein
MKRKPLAMAIIGVLLIAVCTAGVWLAVPSSKTITPPNESEVELTVVEKGTTYKLYRAALWQVNPRAGKWEFVKQVYDPDFYAKNYVEQEGTIYRKTAKGDLVPVRRRFADGFEDARTIRDLISLERGWTEFTLQSPKFPQIRDYVQLRKRLLKGQSDFVDNRVEPTSEVVHSGRGALKTFCVAPSPAMVCAKSSIASELLHFVRGDDVWFSGWYQVPEGSGMPFTVMDLETTWISESPGIRIMIAGGKHACFELKWGAKPKYRQPKGKELPFPTGRWVHLKAHLKLSEKDDGVIELWQDGSKIVDARGQTLPLAHSIYNSFEIGISAHNDRGKPATLYVDDVAITDQPSSTFFFALNERHRDAVRSANYEIHRRHPPVLPRCQRRRELAPFPRADRHRPSRRRTAADKVGAREHSLARRIEGRRTFVAGELGPAHFPYFCHRQGSDAFCFCPWCARRETAVGEIHPVRLTGEDAQDEQFRHAHVRHRR